MAEITTELPTEERPLTNRQRRFAAEYIRCGVGGKAARAAGYSENGADRAAVRCLEDPRIRAIVERGMNEISAQAKVDRSYVLRQAVEGLERCMGKDGAKFNSQGAARFLEIIAKHSDIAAFVKDSDKDSKGPAALSHNTYNILVQKIQAERREREVQQAIEV